MANWKGIDFAGDLARVVRHMPEVETYRESLQTLQAVWDNLTVLAGEQYLHSSEWQVASSNGMVAVISSPHPFLVFH